MFDNYSFRMKLVKDGTEQEVNVSEEIKSHFERNKRTYITGGVVLAGITCLVMRERHAGIQSVPDGPAKVTVRPLSFFSKGMTNNIVSVIERGTQGPPSWVVRCKETGDIFLSQNIAAKTMGLSANNLSQHLNGGQDSVSGFTFDRICLAA